MEGMVGGLCARTSTPAPFQLMGEMTGWSPLKWQKIVEGYLGGLGLVGIQIMDEAMRATPLYPSRPMLDITDAPLFKRFVRDELSGGAKGRFYDLRNVIREVVTTINVVEKKDPFRAMELQQKYSSLLAIRGVVNDMDKSLGKLRSYREEILQSSMSRSRKKRIIDDIARQENMVLFDIDSLHKMADMPTDWFPF